MARWEFCACVFFCIRFAQLCQGAEDVDKPYSDLVSELKRKLFKNASYTRNARPVRKIEDRLDVTDFNFVISAIDEVNETTQTVKLHGVIRAKWKEYRLKWSSNEYKKYAKVKKISLRPWRIWQPRFLIMNSISQKDRHSSPVSVIVSKDGTCELYSTISAEVGCAIDLTHFPNDKQSCNITIGNPFYSGSEVHITLAASEDKIDTKKVPHTAEWTLMERETKRQWVPKGSYDHVRSTDPANRAKSYTEVMICTITLKRGHPQVLLTVILPSLITATLSLIGFWIHETDLVCVSYMFNLILHGLFLLDFLSDLPPVNDRVPSVLAFFCLNIGCTFACYLINLVLCYLSASRLGESPLGPGLDKLVKLPVWSIVPKQNVDLGFSPLDEVAGDAQPQPSIGPKESTGKLRDLFFLFKRLFFFIFTVIYASFTISYVFLP